jgi:hypothetical protein
MDAVDTFLLADTNPRKLSDLGLGSVLPDDLSSQPITTTSTDDLCLLFKNEVGGVNVAAESVEGLIEMVHDIEIRGGKNLRRPPVPAEILRAVVSLLTRCLVRLDVLRHTCTNKTSGAELRYGDSGAVGFQRNCNAFVEGAATVWVQDRITHTPFVDALREPWDRDADTLNMYARYKAGGQKVQRRTAQKERIVALLKVLRMPQQLWCGEFVSELTFAVSKLPKVVLRKRAF